MERGRNQRMANIYKHPLLSQEWIELQTSNFVRTLIGSIATKAHFGKSSRGRSQGLSQIFRPPIYTVHRAVIFAIARLSCLFNL